MLKTARLFQDGCVLQQQKPCTVWGEGTPGRTVKAEIQGVSAEGIVKEDGRWEILLPALHASEEENLRVSDGETNLVITKVGIGEVWILGGQSNMEFFMKFDKDYPEEKARDSFPNIRFFDYPELTYPEAEEDFDYSRFGYWRRATAEDLEYFSAVGYYFAQQIVPDLKVPVGLVGCNYGGTPACSWMSPEVLKKHGKIWLDEYENQLHENGFDQEEGLRKYIEASRKSPASDHGNPFKDENMNKLLYGTTREEQLEMLKYMAMAPQTVEENPGAFMGPCHPWRPCGLYEMMLLHVAPYTARGVLWYQGESDEPHGEIYKDVLTDMIQEWRDLWRDDLPFFLVQLAPFGQWLDCEGKRFPIVRKSQEYVADHVDNVYLASIGNVGNLYDIHPKEKQPVGRRLGLLAQKYVYGKSVEADAPRYQTALREDKEVRIQFANAGTGLKAEGNPGKEFEVIEKETNRKLDSAEYEIAVRGTELVLTLKEEVKEKALRILYCKKDYYEANIYNAVGLPAFPFEAEV
ncbi:MAG: sialate O-acetylesterase [Eubacteriales bacterium]|nr:sialate O-acetylesterase [Eubacteriales bacterium]